MSKSFILRALEKSYRIGMYGVKDNPDMIIDLYMFRGEQFRAVWRSRNKAPKEYISFQNKKLIFDSEEKALRIFEAELIEIRKEWSGL